MRHARRPSTDSPLCEVVPFPQRVEGPTAVVNSPLTTDVNDLLPPNGFVDSSEFAKARRRVLVQWAMEVLNSDATAFAELVEFSHEIDDAIAFVAKEMRKSKGLTWANIAEPLGITRQAAQRRWGKKRV